MMRIKAEGFPRLHFASFGKAFRGPLHDAERSPMKSVPDIPNRPKPLGPYSHVVVANGFVFISAQTPLKPGGSAGEWTAPDVKGQTRQCLANIRAILEELGLSMSTVVKVTVYLADPQDFAAMNEAYAESFPEEPPARSPAKLGTGPPGLKVAIDAIAVYEPREEE
jgi:2-iminobutanoate/2-iminopropanoate deaminase